MRSEGRTFHHCVKAIVAATTILEANFHTNKSLTTWWEVCQLILSPSQLKNMTALGRGHLSTITGTVTLVIRIHNRWSQSVLIVTEVGTNSRHIATIPLTLKNWLKFIPTTIQCFLKVKLACLISVSMPLTSIVKSLQEWPRKKLNSKTTYRTSRTSKCLTQGNLTDSHQFKKEIHLKIHSIDSKSKTITIVTVASNSRPLRQWVLRQMEVGEISTLKLMSRVHSVQSSRNNYHPEKSKNKRHKKNTRRSWSDSKTTYRGTSKEMRLVMLTIWKW